MRNSVHTEQRALMDLGLHNVRLSLTCQSRYPRNTRVVMVLNTALKGAVRRPQYTLVLRT